LVRWIQACVGRAEYYLHVMKDFRTCSASQGAFLRLSLLTLGFKCVESAVELACRFVGKKFPARE
jgi:hypothetical protein